MINAPQAVKDALTSGNFIYANLITINLGDVYGTGSDSVIYYTDYHTSINLDNKTYTPNHNIVEIDGISRKASTGSDKLELSFSVTDPTIIQAIKTEKYVNKPTSINRCVIQDGSVLEGFLIPVRTAWGLSHSFSGGDEDRIVTLVIDSVLGALSADNGWYAIDSSHQQRYPNDRIMRHSPTVFTGEQKDKYTANFNGTIDQEVKPPALPKIYGAKNAELVPILMLKHRKSKTFYRHYFTTFIYVISIGECDYVDVNNIRLDDDSSDITVVTNTARDVGGWSCRVRTPADASISSLLEENDNGDLGFWFEHMDVAEKNRLTGMRGEGLTLLFVKNRNRDDWLNSPPKITMPVRGAKVYDPRLGAYVGPYQTPTTVFSRNPALQYADYLRSVEYGAGKRNIPITNSNIIELANHFDNIPDSIGNDGINSILIDVQIDTGKPIVDNMNVWMQGTRLYTSDYYGEFNVRVETKSSSVWTFNEDDLEGETQYESGDFTERLNSLTYTIKQLVQDESEGSQVGGGFGSQTDGGFDDNFYLQLGDLVEVDVETTFPEYGTAIHAAWLAEDGGIANFSSSSLDYVSEVDQALYWTMVDARISRQPRTLEIPVGAIGWLFETGDVIQHTSEIMEETNAYWRVSEVSENGGETVLNCIAYDDTFYVPDPNVVPTPIAFAKPPITLTIPNVTGFELNIENGEFYLQWDELDDSRVLWYAVEIYVGGLLVQTTQRVPQSPLLITNPIVESYTANIVPYGINLEGQATELEFTIDAPVTPTDSPTFEVEAGALTITPESPANGSDGYEGVYSTIDTLNPNDDSLDSFTFIPFGLSLSIASIVHDQDYYVWYRIKTRQGYGDWVLFTITGLGISQSQFDESTSTQFNRISIDGEFDDSITGLNTFTINTRSELDLNLQNIAIDVINGVLDGAGQNYITADYVAEINGFRAQIDEQVGTILIEGGAVTANEFNAVSLLVDTHKGQIATLVQKETVNEGILTLHTSQISQTADDISLIQSTINGTDYDSISVRLDGAENAVVTSSVSTTNSQVDLINQYMQGAITTSDLIETAGSVAVAQTSIQTLSDENSAQAIQSTAILAIANDAVAGYQGNIIALANETTARTTAENLLTATIDTSLGQISSTASRVTEVETLADGTANSLTTVTNTVNNPTTGLAATAQIASGAKVTADGAASSLLTITNTVNNPTTGLAATAEIASGAKVTAEGALSSATTITNTVNNPTTGLAATALIATDAKTIGDNLFATATMGVDVNGNFTGIRVSGSEVSSEVIFQAEKISFVDSESVPKVYFDTTLEKYVFEGDIQATSGSFTGAISGATITGTTLTGGTVQTSDATADVRVVIDGDSAIPFWYGSGVVSEENGKFYAKDDGSIVTNNITITGDSTYEGEITAESGTIGGWSIDETLLRSADTGARVELNSTKNRISIFDDTVEKVVMGYLDGLPKNPNDAEEAAETEVQNWTAGDYGFWAAAGDKLVIDGDVQYKNGDWMIQNDASYLVQTAAGQDIIRMGTSNGTKGLFMYNSDNVVVTSLTQGAVRLGAAGADQYMEYTSTGLVVKGDITGSSGTFSGAITGGTITGGIVQTSASTEVPRVVLNGTAALPFWFGTGAVSTTNGKFYGNNAGNIFAKGLTIDGNSSFAGTLSGANISGTTGTFSSRVAVNSTNGYLIDIRPDSYMGFSLWYGLATHAASQRSVANTLFGVNHAGTVYAKNIQISGTSSFSGALSGATGSFSGTLTASTITGSNITGGIIQTAGSNLIPRVVLNGAATIPLWFGTGLVTAANAKFYGDNAGNIFAKGLNIDGDSSFAGSLNGADITGASGAFSGSLSIGNRYNVSTAGETTLNLGTSATGTTGKLTIGTGGFRIIAADAATVTTTLSSIGTLSMLSVGTPVNCVNIYGGHSFGVRANGATNAFYSVSGGYGPFTGTHDALILNDTTIEQGDIVFDSSFIASSSVSDAITEIAPTATANTKSVLGIFVSQADLNLESLPAAMTESLGYEDTHQRAVINSVGEGMMNVCGQGGNIEAGDLITSSDMSGKGMKQDDDIVRNYTVAKARQGVYFSDALEVQQIAVIYMCG